MKYTPLREIRRDRPAAVIPSRQESSMLDWLESSGRLIARDTQDPDYLEEEEEISDLMAVEDVAYDDIDDDDDLDLEE